MDLVPLALTFCPEARESLQRLDSLHSAVANIGATIERAGLFMPGVLGKVLRFAGPEPGIAHRLWRRLSIAELQVSDEAVRVPDGGFDSHQVRCYDYRKCVADYRELYFFVSNGLYRFCHCCIVT